MSYTPTLLPPFVTQAVGAYQLGFSTALTPDGLTLVAGAAAYGTGGGVYTYDWDGTAWVQIGGVLTPAGVAAGDVFGADVSISADGLLLVVGAGQDDVGAVADQGAAYVFYRATRATTSWTACTAATIPAVPTPVAADLFAYGLGLSSDGNTLAVGGRSRNTMTTNAGGVYVYTRSGTGAATTFTLRDSVFAPDFAADDDFGTGVGLNADGTVMIVGANSWEGATTNMGGCYVFDYISGAWYQRGAVVGNPFPALGTFGYKVRVNESGTRFITSAASHAPYYTAQGAAYIFDWDGSGWVLLNNTSVTNPYPQNDEYVTGVGINGAGSLTVLGHYGYNGTFADQGRVGTYALEEGAVPGAWGNFSTPALTTSGSGNPREMTGELTTPSITVQGEGNNVVDLTLPAITLEATLHVGSGATGAITLPLVTMSGEGGTLVAALTLPAVTATGAGVVGLLASGDIVIPAVTVASTGAVSSMMSGAIELPSVTATGTGILGTYATGTISLYKLRTAGQMYAGASGYGSIEIPAITMDGVCLASLVAAGGAKLPMIRLSGKSL